MEQGKSRGRAKKEGTAGAERVRCEMIRTSYAGARREGISGDARRKRLTAPWIHNFYLRLVGNDCDAKLQRIWAVACPKNPESVH